MRATAPMRRIRKSVLQVDEAERRSPSDLISATTRVMWLARVFYLYVAWLIAVSSLRFAQAYTGTAPHAPLWPIRIFEWLLSPEWFKHATVFTAAGVLFALWSAVSQRTALPRWGTFLYVLLQVALSNSYGAINHGLHVLLFTSFALIFLPTASEQRQSRYHRATRILTVFWFAQALVLLPYTLAGIQKLYFGGLDALSPSALTRTALNRALDQLGDIPPALPIVVRWDLLSYAMWLGLLYVQVTALLVVFRPRLHRLYGFSLILFHLLSGWTLRIFNEYSIFLLGLFLLLSPLAPDRFSLSGTVRSLPLVGIPFRLMQRRQRSQRPQETDRVWLVYDGECPMCNNYAQYLRLRQSVGEFVLVDARQGGPIVDEVRRLPHDLNDGMVVKMGDRHYVGHEALHVLALLAADRGAFSKFNRLAFSSPLISRFTYPLMKAGRWVLLKLKGVAPIQSHD